MLAAGADNESKGSGVCLVSANWKMQTVSVLHGCLCQYGITTAG